MHNEVSIEEEVHQVNVDRPHVVIVGAGASRAAFPDGDRNGCNLPLMSDFCQIVEVNPIFDRLGITHDNLNFEELYCEVAKTPSFDSARQELESVVYNYFSNLALPDHPTLYDYLLLSLRKKDVVATFNWDPFLISAARRNHRIIKGNTPTILFLHGNVLAGYCVRDQVHGVRDTRCSHCGEIFTASRLLYPVAEKNYENDPMIADAWRAMRSALKSAFMITVFGYGAPVSDKSARQLLIRAWGPSQERQLEQFEIINTLGREELITTWRDFIYSHHYEIHSSLYESWIYNHPRRTGEAYINQYVNAKFIAANPPPRNIGFNDLWRWYEPLVMAEANEDNVR